MNSDSIEILTIEEFAERLKIGRTTFFEWKKRGMLKAGQDFIQAGRVIRILWSANLIQRLLESSAEPDSTKNPEGSKRKVEKVRHARRKPAVNFEY